jgi:hypothetical protein
MNILRYVFRTNVPSRMSVWVSSSMPEVTTMWVYWIECSRLCREPLPIEFLSCVFYTKHPSRVSILNWTFYTNLSTRVSAVTCVFYTVSLPWVWIYWDMCSAQMFPPVWVHWLVFSIQCPSREYEYTGICVPHKCSLQCECTDLWVVCSIKCPFRVSILSGVFCVLYSIPPVWVRIYWDECYAQMFPPVWV